ncbi:hypothetical protein [Pseudomonas putida]|uniref:hypothetical protein n=1 Tax=Pseudomonas putida TaxID=303 RepID=UPI002B24FC2A|nr:hypothetical protein [Pseudomonas putida]
MFLPKDRLASAIHGQVAAAEMKIRHLRFIPRQALKRPLHAAVAALAATGEAVLADGTKVIVPQVTDAFTNASLKGPVLGANYLPRNPASDALNERPEGEPVSYFDPKGDTSQLEKLQALSDALAMKAGLSK